MAEQPPIRIANIWPIADPDWVWIRDDMAPDFTVAGRALDWSGYSMETAQAISSPFERRIAKRFQSLARFRGAQNLARDARAHPFDVIVSHGPWPTAWTEATIGAAKGDAKHLAFSFNFTDLPTGPRKALMQRAFRSVDAFAVFTDAEIGLYADWFDIDPAKIIRAPWGVAPPLTAAPPRRIEGPYFAALGGEARDYETLCEAARLCPEIAFHVIARPHNFDGLSPPDNLTVSYNLPLEDAWGAVWHAEAAIIPLRSRETPCGLVTLVGGMHLGKAQIVTRAAGVSDYLEEGKTGLMIPDHDPAALAAAVRRLAADKALTDQIGAAARTYAASHCDGAATVRFFEDLLSRWFS